MTEASEGSITLADVKKARAEWEEAGWKPDTYTGLRQWVSSAD
jgi:hypothetical protein